MTNNLDPNEKTTAPGYEQEKNESEECSKKNRDEENQKDRLNISILHNQYSILGDLEDY
jgi:hypothetical protein